MARRALSLVLEWRRLRVDLAGWTGVLLEILSIETLPDPSRRPVQDRRLRPGLPTPGARAPDVPGGRLQLVDLVAAGGRALVEVGGRVGGESALLDQSRARLSRG